MTGDQVLQPGKAHTFAFETSRALGMPEGDAVITADSMVWNGLGGAVTHSLIRRRCSTPVAPGEPSPSA